MCVLDFKPIAFKSVAMSREMYGIKADINSKLDPLQLTYRKRQSAENTISAVTDNSVTHMPCSLMAT